MEVTPPKLRFIAVFQYGIGWGLGQALVPLINEPTKNYRHFLMILLAFQLLLLPYLNWGVFESIRWLISESDINRAQIELRRACKWNRRKDGAQLAQKIAHIQVQQLRKAGCVLETKLAPGMAAAQLAAEQQAQVSQELSALGHTIRRSFALPSPDEHEDHVQPNNFNCQTTPFCAPSVGAGEEESAANGQVDSARFQRRLTVLSPTLARKSFSITDSALSPGGGGAEDGSSLSDEAKRRLKSVMDQLQQEEEGLPPGSHQQQDRQSLTTQALVQLALKHSNAIQQQEEGSFFVVRMFHRKLWKMTTLLMLISVMLETTYYSMIQANGFVGTNVNLNYYSGAIIEWIGAFTFIFVLWAFNRRLALIVPTLAASAACLGIAIAYHLLPDNSGGQPQQQQNVYDYTQLQQQQQQQGPTNKYLDVDKANITGLVDQPGSLVVNDTLYIPSGAAETLLQNTSNTLLSLLNSASSSWSPQELLELRDRINFWFMILGKLSVTVAIQIGAVIAMEAYPNNLRQSGSGAIVFVGRIGSILAPFLINDASPERTTFKLTLTTLALLGILITTMVPCFLPDNKDQELCDRLNEIPDDTSDGEDKTNRRNTS